MTEELRSLAAATTAGALALALGPSALAWLRRTGVVDRPNHRSSHRTPTVRGAGVLIAIGAPVATVAFAPGRTTAVLVAVGLALAAVGLADDLRTLGATVRLAAQGGAGVVLGLWVFDARPWWIALGAAFFTVAYVNATNFMDGINGITGLHGAVFGGAIATAGIATEQSSLAVGGAALAGASLGFLPLNLPTARAFPGDVGSYAVGAWIAGLVALGLRFDVGVATLVGPGAVYLADTGWVLCKRALRGERLSEPHREHVYQRLVDGGWDHAPTAALVAVASALTATVGRLADTSSAWWLVGGAAVCAAYLALPSAVVRPTPDSMK